MSRPGAKRYSSLIAHCSALLLILACRSNTEQKTSATLFAQVVQMRTAIHAYYDKHHAYPRSLQELVRDGELRAIPVDPITKSSATWRTTVEENVRVDDFTTNAAPAQSGGIIDVRSGAAGRDRAGKPWSDY